MWLFVVVKAVFKFENSSIFVSRNYTVYGINYINRERETDRDRDRQRQTETETERDRDRQRQTETETERKNERKKTHTNWCYLCARLNNIDVYELVVNHLLFRISRLPKTRLSFHLRHAYYHLFIFFNSLRHRRLHEWLPLSGRDLARD